MYKIAEELQQELKDFYLPFGGSLDERNRWVRLAAIIRWDEIEKRYARQFSKEMGDVKSQQRFIRPLWLLRGLLLLALLEALR